MTWLMTWSVAFSQGIRLPLCQILLVVCMGIGVEMLLRPDRVRILTRYREQWQAVTTGNLPWGRRLALSSSFPMSQTRYMGHPTGDLYGRTASHSQGSKVRPFERVRKWTSPQQPVWRPVLPSADDAAGRLVD
jgi:hypothetical protein